MNASLLFAAQHFMQPMDSHSLSTWAWLMLILCRFISFHFVDLTIHFAVIPCALFVQRWPLNNNNFLMKRGYIFKSQMDIFWTKIAKIKLSSETILQCIQSDPAHQMSGWIFVWVGFGYAKYSTILFSLINQIYYGNLVTQWNGFIRHSVVFIFEHPTNMLHMMIIHFISLNLIKLFFCSDWAPTMTFNDHLKMNLWHHWTAYSWNRILLIELKLISFDKMKYTFWLPSIYVIQILIQF